MREPQHHDRPVNLWYPCASQVHSAAAGKVSCERFSDPAKARSRAEELIRCGAALGPLHIEDVETGVIVDRVSRPQ